MPTCRILPRGRRRTPAAAALAICAALLTASGTLPYKTVPEPQADGAELPGLPGVRDWGDEAPTDFGTQAAALSDKLRRRYATTIASGVPTTLDHLALSGGGEDGAFGAGLLLGWAERGDRPEFQTVTGVSVGAIIAPFAFLGPRYDAQLRALVTTIGPYGESGPGLMAALFGVALVEKNPLAPILERFLTAEMMDEIGREYGKGRMLLIGTTNLNAGRPVIWNIGRLATSGHPRALEIFRKIVLASSAIPGVFNPILFDVHVDGREFQEVHVDGGVTTVAFIYPVQIKAADFLAGLPFEHRLYIIRNRKLTSDYDERIAGLFSIVERSIRTLIRSQGNSDLYQIYYIAQRDGIDYNLAYIPSDFDGQPESLFDDAYIRQLFDVGYRLGKSGYPWAKTPPGTAREITGR